MAPTTICTGAPHPINPILAKNADELSSNVTDLSPTAASDPVIVQLSSKTSPVTLSANDPAVAITLPSNETVTTPGLLEAAQETMFVGELYTLGPTHLFAAEQPVSTSSSRNMMSPWTQHLFPSAVDQVLLDQEQDRSQLLHWHDEQQDNDDAFVDDSLTQPGTKIWGLSVRCTGDKLGTVLPTQYTH
jgi:hypothetical protein